MNRRELQTLAEHRIEDARVLLEHGRWGGAYYLAGYAVETGLKSCIMRFVDETGVIFTDKQFAEKCWTHKIEDLVKQADLQPERGRDISSNPKLGANWSIVEGWTEASRYLQKSEADARQLYDAITDDADGVYRWIQERW